MRWFACTLSILILLQASACRHSEDDESGEATTESIIRDATRLMQHTMEPLYSPDNTLLALMTVHQKILNIPVNYDRTQLQGLTFVLAQASGEYIVDSTRVSAPANGSRFTLYAATVDGLTSPLVEIGYADVSWTEQSDGSATIEVKAVANGQEFIRYSGNGKTQVVNLTGSDFQKLSFPQVANIELAAGELSMIGSLTSSGRELNFEYLRNANYIWRVGINATNEWKASGLNGQQAHYKGMRGYSGTCCETPIFDSDQEASFDLTVNLNTLVNFSKPVFTNPISDYEVRINDDPVNPENDLIKGDSTFTTVANYSFQQVTLRITNIQKLMAPAMYPLLVVL